MLTTKTLLDNTNLFSPTDYKTNDKMIFKYFKDKYVKAQIWLERLEKVDKAKNHILKEMRNNEL